MKTVAIIEIKKKRKSGFPKWEILTLACPSMPLAMSFLAPNIEGDWAKYPMYWLAYGKPNNNLKAMQFRVRQVVMLKASECVSEDAK